jgi:superfamily II DNA or RNA helicase
VRISRRLCSERRRIIALSIMRPVHLDPERHEEPVCDSFTDELAVRRYEQEMRVHRAFTEPFVVTPLEARVDGAYRVATTNHHDYLVDIVDGSRVHDTCTCPDFIANELGTCKHVEVVRLRLFAARRALRKAYARLGESPTEPVLTVDAASGLRLAAVGPWTVQLRVRHARRLRSRPPPAREGESFAPGHLPEGLRVVHAAPLALALLRERARLFATRRTIERAIEVGHVEPDVLRRPLFPYQRDGVLHLVRTGRGMLADDMGLGKTMQAIAACEVLRARGEAKRVLIVTAASLKHQWAQEIERCTGERAEIVGSGASSRRRALEAGAVYTILNYEQTWRELTRIRELHADVLILDEAQRARNFRTKTAATLRAIPSRFLFILTGTPVENRLDDLYSLLQLVDPTILGPLWRFNLDFHVQNERGRISGYKNLSALRARVAPIILRRRKDEVAIQLPPLMEQTRYTAMSREQAELENGYRADAAQLLAIAERRPLRKEEQERLMMFLLKARQACNALELCDPGRKKRSSPKLDEFSALIAEITSEGTAKVLVFSEWVKMLELAAERLDGLGLGYEMLHGSIPTEKRPALLERFRDDPEARVLLSTDAGGVGLNLQVATYVVHLDLPWNPARLDQRTARAHRLGQAHGVLVTYLCAESGIERGIEGTLDRKRAVRFAALDQSAETEEIEAPSFSAFLRQMADVLNAASGEVADADADLDANANADTDSSELPLTSLEPALAVSTLALSAAALLALPEATATANANATAEAVASPPEPPATVEAEAEAMAVAEASLPEPPPTISRQEAPAQNRLRLARVVLDAGFFGDAVRAAYEALSAAVAGLAEGARPEHHAALVALLYRDLLPSGKVAAAVPATLARLHDLSSLEQLGVPVDPALAQGAVQEAEGWVSKIAG